MADAYEVSVDDLNTVTEYVTTGMMIVNVPEDLSEDEVIISLASSIANAIGVSEEKIELSIDSETGEVIYSVSADDYDSAENILEALQSDEIIENIVRLKLL